VGQETYAVVDKVRDVSLVGGVHRVDVLYVVEVKQVCGAFPLLCLICRDDLQEGGPWRELTGVKLFVARYTRVANEPS